MENTRKKSILKIFQKNKLDIKQSITKSNRNERTNNFKNIILMHIYNNKKQYIILGVFFVIGILLGVLYINNVQEEQHKNIDGYINSFINTLKSIESFNILQLIKNGIIDTVIFSAIIWFMGTTVIRNTYCIWNDNI